MVGVEPNLNTDNFLAGAVSGDIKSLFYKKTCELIQLIFV